MTEIKLKQNMQPKYGRMNRLINQRRKNDLTEDQTQVKQYTPLT